MRISVRESPRSMNVDVVVMPVAVSVHTRRSGSTTSSYTARISYRLASASLIITVSKTPPGRGSTLMFCNGVLTPIGPQKWVRCSGSTMHRNTSSRGASNTLTKTSSPAGGTESLIGRLRSVTGLLLDRGKVLVELAEPLGPDPPVVLQPAHRRVQRVPLQMTRPKLRPPAPRDEPAPFQNLQVLRDSRQRQVKRRGQFVDRRVTRGQPSHYRPPRGVGQRGERSIQPALANRRSCRHATPTSPVDSHQS